MTGSWGGCTCRSLLPSSRSSAIYFGLFGSRVEGRGRKMRAPTRGWSEKSAVFRAEIRTYPRCFGWKKVFGDRLLFLIVSDILWLSCEFCIKCEECMDTEDRTSFLIKGKQTFYFINICNVSFFFFLKSRNFDYLHK